MGSAVVLLGDGVVGVADDELFGPDGTQPLPSAPALPDPLAGLVTGFLISNDTPVPTVAAEEPLNRARAQAEVARRRTAAPTRPARSSAPGAVTPDAIPLAQSLPGPQRQSRRQVTPTRPVQSVPARPPAAVRPARSANLSRPAASMPTPGIRTRRTSGMGCAVFVIVAVLLVVLFVVLGAAFGHGNAGFFNG